MTAGKGIVHSERIPNDLRASGFSMNGIQCWVALPEDSEETTPSFKHHPAKTLPEFFDGKTKIKILLGKFLEVTSPVAVHSDLFYADLFIPSGTKFKVPRDKREAAIYLVSGKIEAEQKTIEPYSMLVLKNEKEITLTALKDTRVLLLGGSPVGKRFIYWNFVSSSEARIDEAKKTWRQGPGFSERFAKINTDESEFIPLPAEPGNVKGTIL